MPMKNRIKELRQKNHMSQIRLSIELEVSQETVSAYENGKYYPSFQTLLKLSDIFNASIDYIMGVSDMTKTSEFLNEKESEVIDIFRSLNRMEQELAIAYLNGMRDSSKAK